jgi:hypothetical protein
MKMTDETEVDFTADLHELIPGLGDLTGSNDDVHLTDADMNDPELLVRMSSCCHYVNPLPNTTAGIACSHLT